MRTYSDAELKRWEITTQSMYRVRRLSSKQTVLAEGSGIVWRDVRSKITKEQCIAELKRVANVIGQTPTTMQFKAKATVSRGTVDGLFGAWNTALCAAGLKLNKKSHNRGITKIQTIAEIKRIATVLHRVPTAREFDKKATFSCDNVQRLFGSWNRALKAARLELHRTVGITKPQAVSEIKRVAKLLGRTPTVVEFNAKATFSSPVVKRLFDTWNAGIKAAELAR